MAKRSGRYRVYSHFLDGRLIYIGCGIRDRPYQRNSRNQLWKSLVGASDIDVKIISSHNDYEIARTVERRIIVMLQPPCNVDGVRMLQRLGHVISDEDRANNYDYATSKNMIRRIIRCDGIGNFDLPTRSKS